MRDFKQRAWLLLVVMLCFVLEACSGSPFVRPSADALQLGKTTDREVVAIVGVPHRESNSAAQGHKLTRFEYVYASGAAMAIGGTPSVRSASFVFADGLLVGYEFSSSFSEDSTDFDEKKVERIIKGQSTRRDVEALLGKPSGMGIWPWVPERDETTLFYSYLGAKGWAGKVLHVRKDLLLKLDRNGIVKDVNLTTREDPS